MQKIIYFDKDCEEDFAEYAEVEAFNKMSAKISKIVDKVAIGFCICACVVAIAIMLLIAI